MRASGDAADGKERNCFCTVIGVASMQEGKEERKARRKGKQGGKESKEEGQAKGRQHVKWMVVE